MVEKREMTPVEKSEMLNEYIDHNLRMMVLCGALAAAREMEHGWWCVQFEGGCPVAVEHGLALMLANGFSLGVKHYNDYRREQRELAADDGGA